MSHLVETMAYTNEVPWHGLGEYVADAPSVRGMLKTAKIDWKVERKPMTLEDGSGVDGFAALVRSSDNKVLDVVGSRYQPVQNETAFTFFKEFVEAGQATMETAGSLKGGRVVWGLAKLGTGFKLRGNDQVNGYLLCICPHEQGKSLLFKTTAVRVVCNNTLTAALQEKGHSEWRMNHSASFDEVKIEQAKGALGVAREQISEFEKNARLLQKLNLSREEAVKILAEVYQPELDEDLSPRMKQLMDIYERAPGAQPGNGWGLLNCVTYYADHVASRTADKRLTNAWMGRTAGQKQQVLDKLLVLA
jgi:phage/plasmid-like protein (TIGR03299 family)